MELFADYRVEGLNMPVDRDEFIRRAKRRAVQESTPEERLEGLTPEQLLQRLTPEQRLAGVPPEQRLAGVPPEQRLAGLTPDEREKLRRLLNDPALP